MISAIIAINGKSGSGKDLYANALVQYLNRTTNPEPAFEGYITPILQFATPLKAFVSTVTDIQYEYFTKRSLKDGAFPKEKRDKLINHCKSMMDMFPISHSSGYFVRADMALNSEHLFQIEVDYNKVLEEIEKIDGDITPRDLLKIFGAYGGIVPHWTWLAATRSILDMYLKSDTPTIPIISDLRTEEEYHTLQSYCEARGIRYVTFRIEHWNKNIVGSKHITEVDLDSKDQWFTRILSPKEGLQEKVFTLYTIFQTLAISFTGNKTEHFSTAEMEGALNDVEVLLKQ